MKTSPPDELRIDHHRRVLKVMLYLDTHLAEAVCIKKLAQIACFSPYHFQRIFLSYTGETIGQYQQRKRLERAIHLLTESQMSILDIAFEVGYETHASLNKLINRWTGETPTSIRKNRDASRYKTFKTLTPPRLPKRQKIFPSFEELSEMTYSYIEVHGIEDGNFIRAVGPAFEEMKHWVNQNHLEEKIQFWLGMIPFLPHSYQDPMTPFWFGIALNDLPKTPSSFSKRRLSAGQIAVFEHRGPYNYLLQTYSSIYHGWLPESGYHLRDEPLFERYVTNPQITSPENTVVQLCLPVYPS